MDRELLDNKRIHERDERVEPKDDQDVFKDNRQSKEKTKSAQSKEERKISHLLGVLTTTIEHYFPEFNQWLKMLTDMRNQEAIDYDRQAIVWTEILAMITRRGSRKKITNQMRSEIGCINLKELSGQINLNSVPHADTLEYFNVRAKEKEFEQLLIKMIKALLRARTLEKYRLQNKYHTIAIDGVHCYTFDYKHCEHCLCKTDKKTQKKQWYHYKLQASLVTPQGLCLPIAGEWVENQKEYNKQDCEPKAFCRLIKRLREYFPRLEICVLLDALYATEPVFKLLKENSIEWIIVFKEGRSSKVYNWLIQWKNKFGKENILKEKREKVIPLRQRRNHQEKLFRSKVQYKVRTVIKETTYTWMREIEYFLDNRKFNIMACKETEDNRTNCNYVWLVSDGLKLNKETVKESAKRGRCRWKIENEGFNTQKTKGYNLEHQYSRDSVSMKVWVRVIDTAHFINQLIENDSLIIKKVYGSVRNIAELMFEHFKYLIFKKPDTRLKIQIRLFPDTS